MAAIMELSVNNRDGLVYALLQDTAFAGQLARSLDNVEQGTAAFNEDMEALKHNFLLRGYFRKQDRDRQKHNKNGR
jgi:phospholipid/cholesterol/gamma-HCH transport system substrate-binding protein